MKAQLLLVVTCAALITGCKKDDDPPSPSGGGNNTGGGNNGNGLVASWSPVKPYPDDVITFTGGPFSTDLSQNEVTSGSTVLQNISVTSTTLTVQPPAGYAPSTGGFSTIFIQSGSGADTLYPVYWKRPLNLIGMEDNLDDFIFGAAARPGDSVLFTGSGFTPTGMSFSINGTSVNAGIHVDSAFYGDAYFRIPVSFGSGSDESQVTTALVSVTNADGRSDTLTIGWAPTPDMEVFGLELLGGGSVFDISDMTGAGQVLNFQVTGKYLNSSLGWDLVGPSATSGTLGASGFPSEAFIMLNPASMSAGSYTLWLSGTFISYGFTLVP